ncbi:hypothetical protein, partial [Burkholderia stagnalis]|uniref:hypothetical protein n=1 Tax=Burkholderia stagnalis TaxID=1503054 RepID=UPI0028936C88
MMWRGNVALAAAHTASMRLHHPAHRKIAPLVVNCSSGANAVWHARGARVHRERAVSSGDAQSRSTACATPIPPPMHSDASPRFASRLT